MTQKDRELLEKHGWTVECSSPFEVRHSDGSFASGQGAVAVLEALYLESFAISVPRGGCEYEKCDKEATGIAASHSRLGQYCDEHAYTMADDESPEYHVTCPNCGCRFGVN